MLSKVSGKGLHSVLGATLGNLEALFFLLLATSLAVGSPSAEV